MTENGNIRCDEFEELLSDYLDGNLGKSEHVACASHILACAFCHELFNEVKNALDACHSLAAPASQISLLEARILERTTPQALMACEDFEEHLTDYLDGFLEAAVYHRWERHAASCGTCSDLPGAVVRSIAACYTMKAEEMEVPAELMSRILQATLGTTEVEAVHASWTALIKEWVRGLSFPVQVSQFASVAAIVLFAMMFMVDDISADGSVRGVYEKGFELASQTYRQGTDMMLGDTPAEYRPVQNTESERREK